MHIQTNTQIEILWHIQTQKEMLLYIQKYWSLGGKIIRDGTYWGIFLYFCLHFKKVDFFEKRKHLLFV